MLDRTLERLRARLADLHQARQESDAPTQAEESAAQATVLQALRDQVEAVSRGEPLPAPSEEWKLAREVLARADAAAGIPPDPGADRALAERLAMMAERHATAERITRTRDALIAERATARARGVRAAPEGDVVAPTAQGTLEAKPPEKRNPPGPAIGGDDVDFGDADSVMQWEQRQPPGHRQHWRERPR